MSENDKFMEQMKEQMKREMMDGMMEQMKEQMKREMMDGMMEQMKEEMKEQMKEQMKDIEQMKEDLKRERMEMDQMKKELKEEQKMTRPEKKSTKVSSKISSRKKKQEIPVFEEYNEKKWSVSDFEVNRPHMVTWVNNNIVEYLSFPFDIRRILIHGQVKVGKREIVEYISMRDTVDPTIYHVFISAFHRTADESQRRELKNHNLHVFSVNNKKIINEVIEFLGMSLENEEIRIVIHIDECDYGTGSKQNLSQIYNFIRDHERVFTILYSATPEEVLYSEEIVKETEENGTNFISDFYEIGLVKKYEPPEGYCGASKFLEENLVYNALPFFCESEIANNYVLSEQGKTIIEDAKRNLREYERRHRKLMNELDPLIENEDGSNEGDGVCNDNIITELNSIVVKNIIVLRLTYSHGDDNDCDSSSDYSESDDSESSESIRKKAIYDFIRCSKNMPELQDVAIYLDKQTDTKLKKLNTNITCQNIEWGNPEFWHKIVPRDKVVIIVHDQTSTRSTEWVFHDRIFATHDYRKRIIFNTVAQAQLRSAHYAQRYKGFQPIRIYGHLKTFQLCAGTITSVDYMTNDWNIRKIPRSNPPRYRLKNINADTLLPQELGGELPNEDGYPHQEAEKMLLVLGCTHNGGSKMSQRVRGKCKKVHVVANEFYPVEDPLNPSVVKSVIENIKKVSEFKDTLSGRNFKCNDYFSEKKKEIIDGEWTGKWLGFLRGFRLLEYDTLTTEIWGMNFTNNVRLFECYNNGIIGLCLKVCTPNLESIEDLETWKSMYNN